MDNRILTSGPPAGRVALLGVLALVLVAPAAMGAVAPWARSVLFAGVGVLCGAWILSGVRRGEIRFARHPAWWGISAFFFVVGLTLMPFAPSTLSAIQPGTASLHASVGLDSASPYPFSIAPEHSLNEIMRLAVLVGVFLLAMNCLVTERRILIAVGTLVVLGTFQAFYGFYGQCGDQHEIFGEPHRYASAAVTGTFLNKNHFAGLLEMIIPMTLGLIVALRGEQWDPRRAPRAWRLRLARTLSSPSFLVRVGLLALASLMTVAVMLSLSRAGVVSLVVGVGCLIVASLICTGWRRFALVPLGLGVVAFAAGSAIGLDRFAARLGDAVSGRSAQWQDRVDLSSSGLDYAVDFPVFGTGVGTFGQLFPRYQSGRFGDSWTDYLHNDWLQLFCETGLIGGTILTVTLGAFLFTVVRGIGRAHGRERWVGLGALAGVVAMLVHSLFDYNLSRITSNGIVFALLLAIAYQAPRIGAGEGDSPGFLRIPLGSVFARCVAVAGAILLSAWAVHIAYPRAVADIAYNRYLVSDAETGSTEDYFFLRVDADSAQGTNDRALDEAVDLAPDVAEYRFRVGRRAMEKADALTAAKAREMAARILGGRPGNRVEVLAKTLEPELRGELRAERRPYVLEAEAALRYAVRLSPTVARYHAELAAVLAERNSMPARAAVSMEIARSLAPRRPRVLFAYGVALLRRGRPEPGGEIDTTIRHCFRQAIEGDSAYAARVLAIVKRGFEDLDALIDVTPRTVAAYGNLVIALWRDAAWSRVHRCLDTLDELTDDPATRARIAERRCAALAREGRWHALRDAAIACEESRRAAMSEDRDDILRLRAMGRNTEAIDRARRYLQRDWSHPDVVLQAAEIASLPRVSRLVSGEDRPLRQLYRFVLRTEPHEEAVWRRVLAAARMEVLIDRHERPFAELIEAIVAYRMGRAGEALEILQRSREDLAGSREAHVVDLFLARALERLGRSAEARAAYERVVARVPTHLHALRRLVRLGSHQHAPAVTSLQPAQPVHVDFGGRISLIGYSVRPNGAGDKQSTLTCYWRFHDDFDRHLRPSVHFIDPAGEIVGRADHDFRDSESTHAVELVRTGEVLAVRISLDFDPRTASSMRVGVVSGDTVDPTAPAELVPAWGARYVDMKLSFGSDRAGTEPKS